MKRRKGANLIYCVLMMKDKFFCYDMLKISSCYPFYTNALNQRVAML